MNLKEKEIIKHFDQLCRLCLSRKRVMSSIFEGGKSSNIESKISIYIGIKISNDDGFPSMICRKCCNYINAWHRFKEQCKQCDNILRHCITKNNSQVSLKVSNEETLIKDECQIISPKVSSDLGVEAESFDSDSHDEVCIKSFEDVVKNERDIDQEKETIFYNCRKCGETFVYSKVFTYHICNIYQDKRYICNLCGTDYTTVGAVKTHLHIHKGKHKCSICGKSFPSRFQVEVHKRIHTGEKPYVCERCGKTFAHDKSLSQHMSIHTGIKPYKCDECDYSTTSRSYIKNHKSVHQKEKPFVCEICGQGYTLFSSLTNHQLNHNEQKIFACETCGKAFNTKRKLGSHKIVHSEIRPHHCDFCGKKFLRKEGLKEHRVVHTGERKFSCPVCKKQFAWRKILRTHKCSGSNT